MLVGDGELRPEIEQKVASYNLTDKVRFLGLRNDVKRLYNCMDVFVLPSWYEGLPVVSVEAQANGLPSVFSDYITRESALTKTASFLSLTEGTLNWAAYILHMHDKRNANALAELQEACFDIKERTVYLEEWYNKK